SSEATPLSSTRPTTPGCTSPGEHLPATKRRPGRWRPPSPPGGRAPPPPPQRLARSVDKGHGRREERTLRTTTILTLHQKWPGLAQGFELTRKRTIKGQTTVEVIYGITSLKEQEANARHLLELARR